MCFWYVQVRDTSHKPDEIYGLIERLAPGLRKVGKNITIIWLYYVRLFFLIEPTQLHFIASHSSATLHVSYILGQIMH